MPDLRTFPSPAALRAINLVTFAATATIALAALLPLEHDLEADAGFGIVSLELAFTNARTRTVLDSWASRGALDAARYSMEVDFVFLVAYATFLAGFVVWAARRFGEGKTRAFGLALAPWCLGAGFFDAVENACCLTTLYLKGERSGDIGSLLPFATGAFASAKFAIVGLAIGYGIAGLVKGLR